VVSLRTRRLSESEMDYLRDFVDSYQTRQFRKLLLFSLRDPMSIRFVFSLFSISLKWIIAVLALIDFLCVFGLCRMAIEQVW
jgi:hypothetical protein